jgi:O-antigen ligase
MRADASGMAFIAWVVIAPMVGAILVWSDGMWKAVVPAGCVGIAGLLLVGGRRTIRKEGVGSGWEPQVAIFALLMGTLVWRQRDAQALAGDPLDAAALIRGGWILLGLGVAVVLYLQSSRRPGLTLGWSVRLMIAYGLAAVPGIALSETPFITLLRVAELGVFIAVPVLLWEARGRVAAIAMRDAVVTWLWGLAILAWANALLVPGAVARISSPIPWQVTSVWPAIPANGVGTIGAAIAAISFGRFISVSQRRGRLIALLGFGFGSLTLVAAQYRTGYLGLTTAIVVTLLVSRGRTRWALFTLVFVAVLAVTSLDLLAGAGDLVLRGETVLEASDLSSRLDFWSSAVPVWEESPLFGQGLLTATRFEVLETLGFTSTSTIHSTWVEALVGTGLLGATLLVGAVIAAIVGGWRALLNGSAEPLALFILLTVRSLTGSTVEIAGLLIVVFLAFVLCSRSMLGLHESTVRRHSMSSHEHAALSGMPSLRV